MFTQELYDDRREVELKTKPKAAFEKTCRQIAGLSPQARQSRLSILRRDAHKNRELTRAALAVLEAVLDRINWKLGYWYPSVQELAEETGKDRRTVFRSLAALEHAGILLRLASYDSKTGRQQKSKMTLPGLLELTKSPRGEGDTNVTQGVTRDVTGEGDFCCHASKDTSDLKTSDYKITPPTPRKRGRRERYDFLGLVEEIGAKGERDRIIATALRQMAHLIPSFHGDSAFKRAQVENLAKVAASARKYRFGKNAGLEDLGLPTIEELDAVFSGEAYQEFVNRYEKTGEYRHAKTMADRVIMPGGPEFKRFIEKQLQANELARERKLRDERRAAEEAYERLRADEINELVRNAKDTIKRGKVYEESKALEQIYESCPSDLRAIVFRRLHRETGSWTLQTKCDDWGIELGRWQ